MNREIPEELSNLPGIDVAAGLQRVRGNLLLYKRLLSLFHRSCLDFEPQFRSALDDPEDPLAATRSTHSLKSAAGNIGALGVQASARELEIAGKERRQDIDQRAEDLMRELRWGVEGLHHFDA